MAKSRKIYLDYAASISPNPSSIHELGMKAKEKLKKARKAVADILKAQSSEIIFTSGGTESNNLAIQGVVIQNLTPSPLSLLRRGVGERWILPHIITTNIEHPSVLETFKLLKKRKFAEISIIPVEKNGIIDPKKIKKEIKKNTILISVMYANNEIGTIQPIREIAKEIRHFNKNNKQSQSFNRPCLFHTDATQAVNYLNLNVEKLGVDLVSFSGSKIEKAGRVGVLYKKKSVSLAPILGGGDQEMKLRPGTENLREILKFSKALKLVQKNKEKENKRLIKLRDYFIKKLKNFNFILNGDLENRLPNNINITFSKIPSDLLVLELSAKGIMASSKSACKSSKKEGSYVIEAIRSAEELPPFLNGGNSSALSLDKIGGVRFSLGRETTRADIDYTVKALAEILKKLKKWYN